MPQHFILSVISDDKPGIVKQIAHAVSEQGGSWLESRLAQLAGKFAGIIRVSVNKERENDLKSALAALKQNGISITVEPPTSSVDTTPYKNAAFSLAGPDRNGIVRELAQAFALHNINVEEITTRCSSMPYSGAPLFEAEGSLQLPTKMHWDSFVEQVNTIADELALDIQLEQDSSTPGQRSQ